MSTASSHPPTHDTTTTRSPSSATCAPNRRRGCGRTGCRSASWPSSTAIRGWANRLCFSTWPHRVSNSGVMPDGAQGASGNVIILNAEDDPAETIQPRLAAAGANPERVFHLGEVNAGNRRRQVQIPDDAPLLGRLIAEQDARLLIVDPLLAFLAGADANCDHIRRV